MMAAVAPKHTKPELAVRKGLHRLGFRFRLHDRKLPGSPDLVLPKYSAVIFVHGCYWHRHQGCRYATTPSTRPEFWEAKFDANVERDRRNQKKLRQVGWRVFVIWECALRRDPENALIELAGALTDRSVTEFEAPRQPV